MLKGRGQSVALRSFFTAMEFKSLDCSSVILGFLAEPKKDAALFKKCATYSTKRGKPGLHRECLLCLGEAHIVSTCKACLSLTPRARQDRASHLKVALYERALCLPEGTEKLSASTLLVPIGTLASAPLSLARAVSDPLSKKAKKKKKEDKHWGKKPPSRECGSPNLKVPCPCSPSGPP
uniref:Uncharacterized protein n=1 Tax=Sphaerodactylus townsendi TaxID=933632 RepID=A0ACB8ENQ6_9SAUR